MNGAAITPTDRRASFDLATEVRACRVCGCTDNRACPGSCWWIEFDLCSSCKGAAAVGADDPGEPQQ